MPPNRPLIMASVMIAIFMIAIEATIVSTAMPQIAAQLGDLHLYSWVFSAFLLSQSATTVVFGKLADLYGRRPILIVGIVIFLVGTLFCGFAWSMPSLIAFRLMQGLGAGAIQPICLTVVGDFYPGRERGKIQGYLASVWGISSVLGPLAGGLLTQHLGWAWVFWINVPVGIAAMIGLLAFLREPPTHAVRSVDILGAALFAVAVAALMVALTETGAGSRLYTFAALIVCIGCTILFVRQERRCRDPMIVFALWARRPIATANAATLLSGMAIIGLTTFLPMYVQGVLGRSTLVAGFTLTAMSLGWPIGSTFAARRFARYGLRRVLLCGSALVPLGAVAFVALGVTESVALAGLGSLVMGLGMGALSTACILIVQGSVGWSERGAVTASNIFSRNLGSTLGAAMLGGVLNLSLTHRGGLAAIDIDDIRQLLDHSGTAIADAGLRSALSTSLHLTFWVMFLVTIGMFLLATLVPAVTVGQEAAAD